MLKLHLDPVDTLKSYNRLEQEERGIEEDQPPTKCQLIYTGMCTSLINLVAHVLVLAIFEPFFFFMYVTVFERKTYLKNIDRYVDSLIMQVNHLSQKYVDIIRELFFGTNAKQTIEAELDHMHVAALQAEASRDDFNHHLMIYAAVFTACIMLFLIGLVVLAKLRNVYINWCRIIVDNLIIVLLIGLYEFFFFQVVVSRYKIESSTEVNYYILNKITSETSILSDA